MATKEEVKFFWNKKPCGTLGIFKNEPNLEYFESIKKRRYALEPFIKEEALFTELRGKKVLEVGCGVGTDGIEFIRSGADYVGIDASDVSVNLAKRNFTLLGFDPGRVGLADAEQLPFPDNEFDFIYSWGVFHHTPDMERAVSEVRRVLKPGGNFCIMLYNRFSLVGLQLYILYGLLRLDPFISFEKLFAEHHESPGTKALTDAEAVKLFRDFKNISVKNIVTPYDLRITRNVHWPLWFGKAIPQNLGFFKVIRGIK